MDGVTLEVTITFKGGMEHVLQCAEHEYASILDHRSLGLPIQVDGYYDCYVDWAEVLVVNVTDVTQGDEYGQDEATTAA